MIVPRATVLFKVLLGALLLVTGLLSSNEELFGLLVFGLPYIIALLLPIRYTHIAVGLSLGAVVSEFPFCVFFSFFGGLFPSTQAFLGMWILSALLFAVGVACLLAYHGSVKRTDKAKFTGAGALSLIYIFAVIVVATGKPLQNSGAYINPNEILGPINMCTRQFAERHKRRYPAKLSELGPGGSGCLDANMAMGRFKGVKIEYSAEEINGERSHYDTVAREDTWFKSNVKSFYSDESGIIHEVNGKHAASSHDPVIRNPTPFLRSIAGCLIDNAKWSASTYPKSLKEFPEDSSLPKSSNRMCSREYVTGAGLQYQTYGARVEYTPTVSQGSVKGFSLEARPHVYGKNGTRSYLVDETAIVRGTPEDRPAAPTDPPIPSCEYDFNPCRDR